MQEMLQGCEIHKSMLFGCGILFCHQKTHQSKAHENMDIMCTWVVFNVKTVWIKAFYLFIIFLSALDWLILILSYYSLTSLSTTALKSHSPFLIYNRFVEFWRSVLPNATQAESIFQSFDVGGYIQWNLELGLILTQSVLKLQKSWNVAK